MYFIILLKKEDPNIRNATNPIRFFYFFSLLVLDIPLTYKEWKIPQPKCERDILLTIKILFFDFISFGSTKSVSVIEALNKR